MIWIPTITLWQPWASWIAMGWKTIETRTHDRFAGLLGQRIAIHAGQHWDKDWFVAAQRYLTDEQLDQTEKFKAVKSCIVATAEVCKVGPVAPCESSLALIECQTPRQGLWLRFIEPLKRPLFAKGHQGIWKFQLIQETR